MADENQEETTPELSVLTRPTSSFHREGTEVQRGGDTSKVTQLLRAQKQIQVFPLHVGSTAEWRPTMEKRQVGTILD